MDKFELSETTENPLIPQGAKRVLEPVESTEAVEPQITENPLVPQGARKLQESDAVGVEQLYRSYDFFNKINPEAAAIFKQVADENKMSFDQVAMNTDAWKKVHDVKKLHDALMSSPYTARWLTDPGNMAVAKDDVDTLAALEKMIGDYGFGHKAMLALSNGASQINASMLRAPGLFYDAAAIPQNIVAKATGANWLAAHAKDVFPGKFLEQVASGIDDQVQRNTTEAASRSIVEELSKGRWDKAGETLALQFIQNAPNQAVLLASIMAGYGVPGLAGMGVTTAAQSKAQAVNSGVDEETALLAAIPKGAAEALFERMGTFGLVKHWENAIAKELGKGVSANVMKSFAKTVVYSVAGEGNEEFWTSVVQDLTDYTTGVNPQALTGIGQRALDAGIIGGFSGGTMTAPTAMYLGSQQYFQNRHVENTKKFYQALGENAVGSKLHTRLPSEYGKVVEQLTKDGPVKDIYIPVEQFDVYLQSREQSPKAFAAGLGAAEAYAEAKATGGAIKIPLSQWVEKVVGTDLYQGFAEDVKFSEDSVTPREYKLLQSQVEAQMQEAQAQADESVKTNAEQKAALDKHVEDIKTRLITAGMKEQEATKNAQIEAKRDLVESTLRGQTLDQFLSDRRKIQIQQGQAQDPNALNQGASVKNLVAMHNLSAENLIHADRMGGLAVPSLSIGKKEAPLTGFGEITLLGDKNLIDPKKASNKVFNADIYSPRYPSVKYEVSPARVKAVQKMFSKESQDLGRTVGQEIDAGEFQRKGLDAIKKSALAQLHYLRLIGKDIEIPKKTANAGLLGLNPDIEKYIGAYTLPADLYKDEGFLREYKKLQQAEADNVYKQLISEGVSESEARAGAKAVADSWFDEEGNPEYNVISNLRAQIESKKEAGKPDYYEAEYQLRKAVAPYQEEFDAWVDNNFKDIIAKERIYNGEDRNYNTRYLPHTLENVVRVMKRELQSGEGFNYGVGNVRASVAKRYRSIREIQADRDKVLSKEEFEKAKEFTDAEFDSIITEAYEKYEHKSSSSFGIGDTFVNVLIDGIKRNNIERELKEFGFGAMDVDRIKAFLDVVRNMPTEYFEAKVQRAVGLGEFSGAVIPRSTPRAAREVLKRNGIEFVEYNNNDDADRARAVAELSAKKEVLFQNNQEGTRGSITINNTDAIIKFFNRDKSTYMHEMAHLWLQETLDWVKAGKADEKYMARWTTLSEWLKYEDTQEGFTTAQQEQFATAFERYLQEGKAPSVGLQSVFRAFAQWLTKIYKTLKPLDVEMTDDVKAVMDRMLATEEEIAYAQAQQERTAEAIAQGVDPKVAEKIITLEAQASNKAFELLVTRQMKEMTDQHKADLEKSRNEAKARLTEELKNSEARLTAEAVRNTFNEDPDKVASDYMMNKMTDEQRTQFELVAEVRAYATGEELAQEILRIQPLDKEVAAAVETYMLQFADLKDTDKLRDAAVEAVHNEKQGELLALEAAILDQLIQQAEGRILNTKISEAKAYVEAGIAEQKARDILAKKSAAEASTYLPYFTAERNAAEKAAAAVKAKNYAEAAKWKKKQLLNHALARQAIDNQKFLKKLYDQVKDVYTRKKALFKTEENFVQAAEILSRFGFGQRKDYNPAKKVESLRDWASRMDAAYGNAQGAGDSPVNIEEWLYNESDRRSFRALTIDELSDVRDALKNIVSVGNAVNKLFVLNGKKEVAETAMAVARELDKNLGAKKTLKAVEGKLDQIKGGVSEYGFSLKRMDTVISAGDGWKDFGVLHDIFLTPVKTAADYESKLRNEAIKKLQKIFKGYTAQERKEFDKIVMVPEFGVKLSKKELLAMALNLGAKHNRDRLFETAPVGFNPAFSWDRTNSDYDQQRVETVVMKVLSERLSEKDWGVVQDVWDLLGGFWPDIAALHKEMTGFEPKKRDTTSFAVTLQDGRVLEMKGGYYPLAPDARAFEKAAVNEALDTPLYKDLNAGWRAVTKQGHTKQVTDVAYSVSLDIGNITRHLNNVIHDLAFRPIVYDMNRLLKHPTLSSALKRNYGQSGKTYFDQWNKALASGGNTERLATDRMSSAIRWLNNRASTVLIMGRVSVIVQNFANPFLAGNRVEGFNNLDVVKGMLQHGVGKYWIYNTVPGLHGKAREMQEFVWKKSQFMRDRRDNPEYSLQDFDGSFLDQEKFGAKAKEFLLGLIAGTDDMTNIPLWMEAYHKKLEETGDDAKAVDYADLLVSRTTGSGRKYDVAKVLRGSDMERLFSKLYSFWSVEYNNWLREAGRLRKAPPQNAGRFAGFVLSRLMFIYVSAALAGQLPKGDDDKEKEKYLKLFLSYPTSFFPGVREALGSIINTMLDLPDFGIRVAPMESVVENMTRSSKDIKRWLETGDPQPVFESASKVAAYAFQYPQQFNDWFWNAYDYMENNMDFQAEDLFRRRPKKER